MQLGQDETPLTVEVTGSGSPQMSVADQAYYQALANGATQAEASAAYRAYAAGGWDKKAALPATVSEPYTPANGQGRAGNNVILALAAGLILVALLG